MRGDKTRGLTLALRFAIQKRLKDREVSERRQVGDMESLVNPTNNQSGGSSTSHELWLRTLLYLGD